MGIALLTFSSLFQGLSALQRMAAPTPAPALRQAHRANVFKSGRPARASSPFHRAASATTAPARAPFMPGAVSSRQATLLSSQLLFTADHVQGGEEARDHEADRARGACTIATPEPRPKASRPARPSSSTRT